MSEDHVRIETGLQPHDLGRLAQGIKDRGINADVDGSDLVILDEALGKDAVLWIERLIRFNRFIHDSAKREGNPIQPYKPRDLVNLYLAVLVGRTNGSLAMLAHEIIWQQPFANANHRSTTAALIEALNVEASIEEIKHVTEPAFTESKKLLDGSDKSLSNDEAKARICRRWRPSSPSFNR